MSASRDQYLTCFTEVEQQQPAPPPPSPSHSLMQIITLLITFIAIVLMSVCLYFVRFAEYRTEHPLNGPLDQVSTTFMSSIDEAILPYKFGLPVTSRLPPKDQGNRKVSWLFALIHELESQYREQGIRQGFLREDQYVAFSEQAFAHMLRDTCRDKHLKYCQVSSVEQNSTEIGQPEAFLEIADSLNNTVDFILPEEACPYHTNPSVQTDVLCEHFGKMRENNTIHFTVDRTETANDINAIKQLLYKTRKPLLFTLPEAELVYYGKCTDPDFADKEECQKRWTICPDGNGDEYCATVSYQAETDDAVMITLDDPNRLYQTGVRYGNIVGYNDDYIYQSRHAPKLSIADLRGAFILHSSFGAYGHSYDFLMGNRTLENEELVCPNHRSPETWIPAEFDCVVGNKTDISVCSEDTVRILGNGTISGAQLLECYNDGASVCLKDHFYALEKEYGIDLSYVQDNGLYSIPVIEWTDDTEPVRRTIKNIPYWALSRYLRPVDIVENNKYDCGYTALPYKTLRYLERQTWDFLTSPKATSIAVTFDQGSCPLNNINGTTNYSLISNSTHTIPEVFLDGPIPFYVAYP